jgi:hypothetical protein
MIYPIMMLMLPFELNLLLTMLVAVILGLSVDAFSNTFGLHASATLLIGYLRPTILRYTRPNEGYDSTALPSIHDMGVSWFLLYSSVIIFIHHFWFFSFEILRFDLILLILGKTILSSILSLILVILFQYIFFKPSKK